MRVENSPTRLIKLASPFCLHIFGIGIACLINYIYTYNNNFIEDYYPQSFDLNALLSSLLAALLLCGFFYNVYSQKGRNLYNYQMSLDPNIQREIGSNQIMLLKYFPIDSIHSGSVKENRKKQIGLPLYSILTKLQSILFLYPPFHIFNYLVTLGAYQSYSYMYIGPVLGIVGVITSVFLLWLLEYRYQYAIITFGQILYFIIWIIVLAVNPDSDQITAILTWITFLFFAISRPHADINILSYTSIKFTDLYLGIGYFIEMMVVGLLQYHGIVNFSKIFGSTDSPFQCIASNSITFLIILVVLLALGMWLLPRKEFSSLLEIKNWINDGQLNTMVQEVPVVNTGYEESTIPSYVAESYEYENQYYVSQYLHQQYQSRNSTAPSAPPITEL